MASAQALVEEVFGKGAIELAIAESVEIKYELMKRAEEVRQFWVDYWESFDHPYSREHTLRSGYVERPGDYSKSIKVKFIEASGGQLFKARVTAHDYKAHWIEYGSTHMPEFAPRAATLAHFGGGTAVS
jgi:hypothetical protein